MPSPALILGGAQVAQGLFSGFSGFGAGGKAAEQARKIGQERAGELKRQAGLESELRIEQKQTELDVTARRRGKIEGMYSQSGLLLTGTPAQAIQEQKETDIYNIEQADVASAERARALQAQARLEIMQAEATAEGYETAGTTDLISGLLSAGTGAAQMYGPLKNWLGGFGAKPGDIPSRSDSMYNLMGI